MRVARELYREVATGEQAKQIYQIGTQYKSADETLAKLGYAPNRRAGERGATPALREAWGRNRPHKRRQPCAGKENPAAVLIALLVIHVLAHIDRDMLRRSASRRRSPRTWR